MSNSLYTKVNTHDAVKRRLYQRFAFTGERSVERPLESKLLMRVSSRMSHQRVFLNTTAAAPAPRQVDKTEHVQDRENPQLTFSLHATDVKFTNFTLRLQREIKRPNMAALAISAKTKEVNIMYFVVLGYIQSSNIILYGKQSVLIDVNRLRDTKFFRFETICKRNEKSIKRRRPRQLYSRRCRRRCRCASGNSILCVCSAIFLVSY